MYEQSRHPRGLADFENHILSLLTGLTSPHYDEPMRKYSATMLSDLVPTEHSLRVALRHFFCNLPAEAHAFVIDHFPCFNAAIPSPHSLDDIINILLTNNEQPLLVAIERCSSCLERWKTRKCDELLQYTRQQLLSVLVSLSELAAVREELAALRQDRDALKTAYQSLIAKAGTTDPVNPILEAMFQKRDQELQEREDACRLKEAQQHDKETQQQQCQVAQEQRALKLDNQEVAVGQRQLQVDGLVVQLSQAANEAIAKSNQVTMQASLTMRGAELEQKDLTRKRGYMVLSSVVVLALSVLWARDVVRQPSTPATAPAIQPDFTGAAFGPYASQPPWVLVPAMVQPARPGPLHPAADDKQARAGNQKMGGAMVPRVTPLRPPRKLGKAPTEASLREKAPRDICVDVLPGNIASRPNGGGGSPGRSYAAP